MRRSAGQRTMQSDGKDVLRVGWQEYRGAKTADNIQFVEELAGL